MKNNIRFMQMRDLTDDEWLLLDKEEILQLYKNCYNMLMEHIKSMETWEEVQLRDELIIYTKLNRMCFIMDADIEEIVDKYLTDRRQ